MYSIIMYQVLFSGYWYWASVD